MKQFNVTWKTVGLIILAVLMAAMVRAWVLPAANSLAQVFTSSNAPFPAGTPVRTRGTITSGGAWQQVLSPGSKSMCFVINEGTQPLNICLDVVGNCTVPDFTLDPAPSNATTGGYFNCTSPAATLATPVSITSSTTGEAYEVISSP
jgi:hypothetical protein